MSRTTHEQVVRAGPVRGRTGARAPAGWLRALEFWLVSYRRTWRASVFSGFLAPLLYLGSLGYGLGSLVDGNGPGAVEGVAYAAFVAPGVLAANAMQTAVGESTYPVISAVKWQRQYLAMIAAPLTVGEVLAGHVAFLLLRVMLGAVAFVAVGALLGAFASPWVLLTIPVAVLCGAVHALPVMGFAVLTESDNSFNMIFRFGVVPMFLFAGTFFPVAQLPAWLQPLAWATPLWHCTELCRDLALSRAELGPSIGHLAYLGAWLVVGALYAVRRYRRRLSE